MVPCRIDEKTVIAYGVDQAVCLIDSARPESGVLILQGFWFSYARKGVALDISNEGVDAFECLLVLALPIEVIVPGVIGPDFIHHLPQGDHA